MAFPANRRRRLGALHDTETVGETSLQASKDVPRSVLDWSSTTTTSKSGSSRQASTPWPTDVPLLVAGRDNDRNERPARRPTRGSRKVRDESVEQRHISEAEEPEDEEERKQSRQHAT